MLFDSFQFPTLQTLGEELVTVLDFLHVKYVIGLGEGAGANVLARFGIANSSRMLGLILINCTGSAATVMENFKNKVMCSSPYWMHFLCSSFSSCLKKCFQHVKKKIINITKQYTLESTVPISLMVLSLE